MKTTSMERQTNKTARPQQSKAGEIKSNASQAFRDLFTDSLKDIYWAEKALTKALPKMIKNATSNELVEALTEHLKVTEEQVQRLEDVFETIGEKAVAKKCEAMEGLIKEAEQMMKDTEDDAVRDAAIIAAGQKVEHYEIATYGTLCTFAKMLNENEAATLLHKTLNEEKEADETLSDVADTINVEAIEED